MSLSSKAEINRLRGGMAYALRAAGVTLSGVDDVALDGKVTLSPETFAALIQQAQPLKVGDRVHILDGFDQPGTPPGTIDAVQVHIQFDGGGVATRPIHLVEKVQHG